MDSGAISTLFAGEHGAFGEYHEYVTRTKNNGRIQSFFGFCPSTDKNTQRHISGTLIGQCANSSNNGIVK
jgi:hypothetical protein